MKIVVQFGLNDDVQGALQLFPHECKPNAKTFIMYHGTSAHAAHKIQREGFKPSTHGMLGRGVYLSRDRLKAQRYGATILKLEVDLGRSAKITQQGDPLQKTWHDAGYDSAWVPPACGMVHSGLEENCVWDPSRIKVLAVDGCCALPNGESFGRRAAGMRKGYMYDLPNRSFYGPHSSNIFHKHIGFHPEIIKQLVLSPDFEPWLKRFRDDLWKALVHDEHRPVFVLYCNSGRHRSVAMSEIVKLCLEEDAAAETININVWNFAQQFWHRSTCDGRCRVCSAPRHATPELRHASNIWYNKN